MSGRKRLTLRCPGCSEHLVVDGASGEVLFHRAAKGPPAGGKDFDRLLGQLDTGKAEAEEIFDREMAAHADRDRLLEERFREALERAAEDPDDGPPPRPFDFD